MQAELVVIIAIVGPDAISICEKKIVISRALSDSKQVIQVFGEYTFKLRSIITASGAFTGLNQNAGVNQSATGNGGRRQRFSLREQRRIRGRFIEVRQAPKNDALVVGPSCSIVVLASRS